MSPCKSTFLSFFNSNSKTGKTGKTAAMVICRRAVRKNCCEALPISLHNIHCKQKIIASLDLTSQKS